MNIRHPKLVKLLKLAYWVMSGLVGTSEIGNLWIVLARMRLLISTNGFDDPGFSIMNTASG